MMKIAAEIERMFGVSGKTIGRLSLYRRILHDLLAEGERYIFSHQLANLVGGSAAQVRRDIMAVGYTGSPTKGYEVQDLTRSIGAYLDAPKGQGMALVGVGNLGRAILAYFGGRRPKLMIEAAFDKDPTVCGRVIHGCRCHPIDELVETVRSLQIPIGIITVPGDEAQGVADKLCQAGVYGLINFAPIRLWVPANVYVEDIDMIMSFEKVAFFARQRAQEKEGSV